MSQALYRQYRPQRFEDVVGQDVAVRTLRNAIEQDRVAHAYLFTGTKGTGKTTLAKLLAKAMNCEQGPTVDPCGTCEECVAIAEGRSMDVAEIDAASNTGIDHVREKIIDTVAFQPSRGRRRVYIVDEAHQLSKSAFNALLKTIEEPPAHVLFVFCTTETHLMMATVRDRCQRIAMRSPGPEVLVDVLERVCEREGITADQPALRAIARASQGSFRNALGTLEMLTTTFGTTVTRDDVLQHLGVVSEEVLFEMADAVIDGNAAGVLGLVERLVQEGVDLDQFARSLAEHLRCVLLQLHGVGDAAVVADAARLAAQAERADERRILGAIDCIADATTRIRVGSDARMSVETALIRACQGLGLPMLAMRLASLEHRMTGEHGAPLAAASPSSAAPTAAPTPTSAAPPAPTASTAPPATTGGAPATDPIDEQALADVAAWWPQVTQRLGSQAAFRPVLTNLRAEAVDGMRLMLRPQAPVMVSRKLREAIGVAAADVTGHRLAVEVLDAPTAPGSAGAEPTPLAGITPVATPQAAATPVPDPEPVTARAAPATRPAASTATRVDADDPGVANVMSMFDATPVAPDAAEDSQ